MEFTTEIARAEKGARVVPVAAAPRNADAPESGLLGWMLDDLSDASWLFAVCRMGMGLCPEMLALDDRGCRQFDRQRSDQGGSFAMSGGYRPDASCTGLDQGRPEKVCR